MVYKAVEELFNQFMKMHFPGPFIVPLWTVRGLVAGFTWEIEDFFFNGPQSKVA